MRGFFAISTLLLQITALIIVLTFERVVGLPVLFFTITAIYLLQHTGGKFWFFFVLSAWLLAVVYNLLLPLSIALVGLLAMTDLLYKRFIALRRTRVIFSSLVCSTVVLFLVEMNTFFLPAIFVVLSSFVGMLVVKSNVVEMRGQHE